MTIAWILFGLGAGLVLLGLNRLWTPLDELWRGQEQHLLARGLAPQRNEAWEKSARSGGWALIACGCFLLVLSIGLWMAVASTPPKMSGTFINGRQLTEAEWDACGRQAEACSMEEAIRESEARK